MIASFSHGSIRSLRYLSERTPSPFPAEAGHALLLFLGMRLVRLNRYISEYY